MIQCKTTQPQNFLDLKNSAYSKQYQECYLVVERKGNTMGIVFVLTGDTVTMLNVGPLNKMIEYGVSLKREDILGDQPEQHF